VTFLVNPSSLSHTYTSALTMAESTGDVQMLVESDLLVGSRDDWHNFGSVILDAAC
jgi:hypothetical protein